jgi:hypothetical protein
MAVFTIFNHGTGFNRAKGAEKNELVHVLSQLVSGAEAKVENGRLVAGNYMINEGPGSDSGGIAMPSQLNPYTGRKKGQLGSLSEGVENPVEASLIESGLIGGEFLSSFRGETAKHWKATGLISGGGWTDNTARAVFILQALNFEENKGIDQVNLIGWSRGAVTCIRIANLLKSVFANTVRCNIFAIDPVAGSNAGLKMRDTQIIPSNVNYFFAILSLHERRKTFAPQDLSRLDLETPGKTRVVYLPMPGAHDQQVTTKVGIGETYQVSVTLAYSFLKHFKTDFKSAPPGVLTSNQQLCEHYAKMRIDMDGGIYKQKQTSGFMNRLMGTGLRRREFAKTKNLGQYVSGGKTSYWVNEHHRKCFQTAFPNVYSLIFASQGRADWVRGNGSEVALLCGPQGLNYTAKSLEARGLLQIMLPPKLSWLLKHGGYSPADAPVLSVHWPPEVPTV